MTHNDTAPIDHDVIAALAGVTTATLTTLLLKKGLRNVWMRGTRPLQPGQPRVVGRAFTLRFVPARAGGSPVAVNVVWLLERTTVLPGAPRTQSQSEHPDARHPAGLSASHPA